MVCRGCYGSYCSFVPHDKIVNCCRIGFNAME